MKNLGYRPKFAAAVEACASSGGQIMPPIMGAAAFIMAEFLEVPYSTIIVAAAIPAFLYYVTIYFMVHLEADKHGIGAVDKKSLPRVGEVLAGGWHLLIALFVLVYFLLVGYTPMKSAIWGLGTLFAAQLHQQRHAHEPGRPAGGAGGGYPRHGSRHHRLRLRRSHHRLGVRVGPRAQVHAVR